MAKVYDSILDLVGKTPLVELIRIEEKEGLQAKLIAKVESFNPAGSVKDRIAKAMIEDAEAKGLLKEGSVIIEPTSGNTGIGLAAAATVKGYRMILTMPETMSVERRNIVKAYGAEVVLTDGTKGMKGAIEKADELAKEIPNSFIAGQFVNPANPATHKKTTGPEIWEDTDGEVDIFVAGVGTGGTITGTGEYLKEKKPEVKIVAVEPASSPVLSEGVSGPHKIQGIGAGFVLETLISSIYEKKNFDKLKDRAFQQFKDRIAQKNQEQDIYISRPNWNRIFNIAACIIIAFFAGIGVMYFTGNQRLSDQTLSYSVESPRGSKLKLSLPDGTSVWLNADSKLLYDNNFGINNRDVTLCGEGYFEVSKNKNLPFQVVSDDIKVEVLGTKFNVKNYPEDPNIKVALLEGSVMLYDSLESTILKPNQIAQYDKQNKKTTLKTIAAENTSAWINGHLYFDEENMETIALALERAFDVNITIKDETLKKMIFYGDFIIESNNIDEIMNIMAATNKFNYHYKIRKNEIEIFQ